MDQQLLNYIQLRLVKSQNFIDFYEEVINDIKFIHITFRQHYSPSQKRLIQFLFENNIEWSSMPYGDDEIVYICKFS